MQTINHPALNLMRDARRWTQCGKDRRVGYNNRILVLHSYADARDRDSDLYYCNFSSIQKQTELSTSIIRRISRFLARKQYLVFGTGLWNDYGPAGSGYGITDAGHALSEMIRAIHYEQQNGGKSCETTSN